jgi:D-3-phosphoglycerate dehydrogenase
VSEEPVSYVNAPQIAAERGVEVLTSQTSAATDYVNLVSVRGGDHAIAGTLSGLKGEPRIVMLDGNSVEVPPSQNMLVVRNDDVPGMIATVSGALARAGINVTDMHLGKSPDGRAAMQVLATETPVTDDVVAEIRAADGIVSVTAIATD